MPGVLEQLSGISGLKLGVCTSKRVDFAERILKLFDLWHLFAFVDGGDVGIQKWQQLQALKEGGVVSLKSLMIGDRNVDLAAAHRNGLSAAGVLWGYGSLEELEEHKPAYMFTAPRELLSLAS
jgi:phosphoglycolate phosphatase